MVGDIAPLAPSAAVVVGDMAPLASVVIILFKSEVSLLLHPALITGNARIVKYNNSFFILPPYDLISSNILYMKTGKRNLNYKLDFKKYRSCSFYNMFAFIFKYVKIMRMNRTKFKITLMILAYFTMSLPPVLDTLSAVVLAFILGLCMSAMRGKEISDALYNSFKDMCHVIML